MGNETQSSCENDKEVSVTSDIESPASEIVQTTKFKNFMTRNKLIFHYLFMMKNNEERRTSIGYNNEDSSKFSGDLSEDEYQTYFNSDERTSIAIENKGSVINEEKEEHIGNNLDISVDLNKSNNNVLSESERDGDVRNLARSYSLKSFLNKSNLKCKSKVIKIRMPFVFSESNLLVEDSEKKIDLIVIKDNSSQLTNKVDKPPYNDNGIVFSIINSLNKNLSI